MSASVVLMSYCESIRPCQLLRPCEFAYDAVINDSLAVRHLTDGQTEIGGQRTEQSPSYLALTLCKDAQHNEYQRLTRLDACSSLVV